MKTSFIRYLDSVELYYNYTSLSNGLYNLECTAYNPNNEDILGIAIYESISLEGLDFEEFIDSEYADNLNLAALEQLNQAIRCKVNELLAIYREVVNNIDDEDAKQGSMMHTNGIDQ